MKSFLDKVIENIISQSIAAENLVFILPNKRAGLFLKQCWRNRFEGKTVWMPQIFTIEEFMEMVSGLKQLDPVTLLFELYKSYVNTHQHPEPFHAFLKWGYTMLSDLSDMDRNLIEVGEFFRYISSLERINKWQPRELNHKSSFIEQEFIFWKGIEKTYHEMRKNLENQSFGYQGMIFRIASERIKKYATVNFSHFVFAGFNALSKAEEVIIRYLKTEGKASVFWDADHYYLENDLQEAGTFLREKKQWDFYENAPFLFTEDLLEKEKNLQLIGTSKQTGQAKLAGMILQELLQKKEKLSDSALVLADENLLEPVLSAIPDEISGINVTMGYPLKNIPLSSFLLSLLKLYVNFTKFDPKGLYYHDVLNVLRSHYMDYLVKDKKQFVKEIIEKNQIFIPVSYFKSHRVLEELFDITPFVHPQKVIEKVLWLIHQLANETHFKKNDLEMEYLFRFSTLWENLSTVLKKFDFIHSLTALQQLYQQVLFYETLSFYGDPLQGLQLMGMLETRLLDFRNIIITSVNEGILPKGKTQDSFIPFEVRKQFRLPTFQENDAIFAYHFYRLIQRAENVYLIYDTENDAYGAGEKSRFLTQLEIELPYKIKHYIAATPTIERTRLPIQINKSDALMLRLEEMSKEGFSPSALNAYIRDPLIFYEQNVLRLKDTDEVEETIHARTLGIIIHNTLEELYKPYLNMVLTMEIIQKIRRQLTGVVQCQFKETYRNGDKSKGKNLLIYKVAQRLIENFLKYEEKEIKKGNEIIIKHLELELKVPFKVKGKTVYLKGVADRIDQVNDIPRLVDYKTGIVEERKLNVKSFETVISDDSYDKALQLLIYAYMYQHQFKATRVSAGIISFRRAKTGIMPLHADDKTLITLPVLDGFSPFLETLVSEILDVNIFIKEKMNK